MSIQEELNDFLTTSVARLGHGLQFDNNITHVHNRANPHALRPPFKFNLCTNKLRNEGRLSEDEVNRVAYYIAHSIVKNRPYPQALAGVPKVGEDLARRVAMCLEQQGMRVPRLRFSKLPDGGIKLVDRADYPHGGEVVLIDDLVHHSLSKQRTNETLREAGYTCTKLWGILDYGQGAQEILAAHGITLEAVATVRQALALGKEHGTLPLLHYRQAMAYLQQT